jgi:dTDP-4-dehydrorhamnose reductase
MLGSAIASSLASAQIPFLEASRTRGIKFDATGLRCIELLNQAELKSGDVIINAVGLTKQRIVESEDSSIELAIKLNVLFSLELARVANQRGVVVYQVATDCVFSGIRGRYTEEDEHDPKDVYGKTKSLGESKLDNVMHIRASLIGPELGRNSLFFEWLRNLPDGSEVRGFQNHKWNGVTSLAFAKVLTGLIRDSYFRAGVSHLVPQDSVTKFELVELVLRGLGRRDVSLQPYEDFVALDRTLDTIHPGTNSDLFRLGEYAGPPSIESMVSEMCAKLDLNQEGLRRW